MNRRGQFNSLSRRAVLGAAGLAVGSTKALAQESTAAAIIPRAPSPKPKNFAFQINGPAERVGVSTERLKRIHEIIQRDVDAGNLSGAVTALARRGELIHYQAHGYANIEAKQPMPLDAIFRMASSSKPVTGVALLMMIEEGKVRLQDPISKFIPEFKDTKVAVLKPGQPMKKAEGAPPRQIDIVPAKRPITILDLATHTSGLVSAGPNFDGPGMEIDPPPQHGPNDTLASFIPKYGDQVLDFQPGSMWAYSAGGGLDTISRVVEITSGMSYDAFLRTRVFEPLGMVDTYFNVPAEKKSRLLPATRKTNGKWVVTPNDANAPPTKYFSGSGGLMSTCRDYMMFEQMLLNRGELNGNRILGSRSVELMGTNLVGDLFKGFGGEMRGHGFGVAVRIVLDSAISDTGRSNGAFGWHGAFGTMSWNDKAEDLTACIMLPNRGNDNMDNFEFAVRQALIA